MPQYLHTQKNITIGSKNYSKNWDNDVWGLGFCTSSWYKKIDTFEIF